MYVIWRQAFDLYAIQDLVSCPWSSISLAWSHATGLPVDYLIGLVEIRLPGGRCGGACGGGSVGSGVNRRRPGR